MFKRNSLGFRLIISFILSIFLPLTLLSAALSFYFYNTLKQESGKLFENTFHSVSVNIASIVDDLNIFSQTPYFHSDIMSDLINFNSPELPNDPVLQFDTFHNYTTTMDNLLNISRRNITSVMFYPQNSEGGAAYLVNRGTGPVTIYNAYLQKQSWYPAVSSADGRAYVSLLAAGNIYTNKNDSLFSVIRIIKDVNTRKDLGAIEIDCSKDSIGSIFDNISTSPNSMFFLLDKDKSIIYTTKRVPGDVIRQISRSGSVIRSWHDSYLTYIGDISPAGWSLVFLSSEKDMLLMTRPVFYITAALGALCLILSILMFAANTRKTLASVRQIIDAMGRMEKGDLTVKLNIKRNADFSRIADSLNQMAARLTDHIEKEHRLEISRKNAQYAALQTQINPHFLYNTLNGFITLNRLGRTRALEDSIISLTRLFRYTCSGGENSRVSEELGFVAQYLNLQKMRFADRISFDVSFDEDVRDIVIPKLLLQPLAENSVIHGLEPYAGDIRIELYAFRRRTALGEFLVILASDTGGGFNDKLVNIRESVGLKNVSERLELFSAGAVLQIRSRAGDGTSCCIMIPLTTGTDADGGAPAS